MTAGVRNAVHRHGDVVVLGGGPGGYTAAFRAADLGERVVLIERHATLGGVCLNVGCIPSKTLLHVAKVMTEAVELDEAGVEFAPPRLSVDRLRRWKEGVVGRLTKGLEQLARLREVLVVRGEGAFSTPHEIEVRTATGVQRISFDQAIIAVGSRSRLLPGVPEDPRIIDSTGALALEDVPARLLVVGGGIIGLEMATVYAALGSAVTIVELSDALLPGVDADLVRPLRKRLERRCKGIFPGTRVARIEALPKELRVHLEGAKAASPQCFDRVLVAIGRQPNGKEIGAAKAGVRVDEAGFIPVDERQRTNVSHIFAIGDVVGEPMLAHKAAHQGKIAAEVAVGHVASFEAAAIPAVAYTDPEVAWIGLTEGDAKTHGIAVEKAAFPWSASGRSLSLGRDEGLTRLLVEKTTHRIVGAGIVGSHAGELLGEVAVAMELGATTEDLSLTMHPHPTLAETLALAAESAEGTVTDLIPPMEP